MSRILWSLRDPLDVKGLAPADEHDDYARDLVAMLEGGANEDDIACYLALARRLTLLAPLDPTSDARVARAVCAGEDPPDVPSPQ